MTETEPEEIHQEYASCVFQMSERSPDCGAIAAALAKAQGQMGHAAKNRTNPHLKSKYADLSAVIDAVRKPLSDNELAYVQVVETDKAAVICFTELMHSSGQWMRGKLVLHGKDLSPQNAGSAITYARRYSLAALCGVASDEEDDAHSQQPSEKKANGKYQHISVSEAEPVDAPAKPAAPAPDADDKAPAPNEIKETLWAACRKMWPSETVDSVNGALKSAKQKPIDWKKMTIGQANGLAALLESLTAEQLNGGVVGVGEQ